MKKTGRPVSPHLTIYAFPVGALSSITNRVTGCALAVGAGGLGVIEILGGSGSSLALMQTIGSQGFLIAASAKCKYEASRKSWRKRMVLVFLHFLTTCHSYWFI